MKTLERTETLLKEYKYEKVTAKQGLGYQLLKAYRGLYLDGTIDEEQFTVGFEVAVKLLLA